MDHQNELRARSLADANAIRRRLPVAPPAWLIEPLLNFTGLGELNEAYATLPPVATNPNPFRRFLDHLKIRVQAHEENTERIPTEGATLLVANHPFGGADGLALGALALSRRSDVRILVNSWLGEIRELEPWLIQIDVFDTKESTTANAGHLLAALRHLRQGGLLIVFPAGTVSQFNPLTGKVQDVRWGTGAATLARHSGATVIPCFFRGGNRPLFHLAGLVHPALRTALLPRELVAKQNSEIAVTLGKPVSPETISRFKDDETLTAWFRVRTYDLERDASQPSSSTQLAIANPVESHLIAEELRRLPEDALLVSQGLYRVYLARHRSIPLTLQEIGRLREVSFRAVGEGTGGARDLDQFDSTYMHLVLWDATQQRVIGACRLAFCDDHLRSGGLAALYTHTLFRYREGLKAELTQAIELGRSFIQPEYQRKPLALAMLWRGIGEVLCRNPSYRRLVGPVSISDQYRGSSLRLMLSFLQTVHPERGLSRHVSPRNAVQYRLTESEQRVLSHSTDTVKELSSRLVELDEEGKRVPVLIERYLELGARVLSVSRDAEFGGCVDALVIVDLNHAPATLLKRFMGAEGYDWYREHRDVAL